VGIGGTILLLAPRGEDEEPESWVEDLEAPGQRPVRLYFGRPDSPQLATEIRWIDGGTATEDLVDKLLRALIEGSRRGLVSPIPAETVLLETFLDGLGGAYLNFSESLRTLHPRGDAMEWLTVRTIVASVTQNVPEIERVTILVDGKQDGSLTDQVPLDGPYTWNDVRP
jgi:hypothetical protein